MRTVVLSLLMVRAGLVWAQQPPSAASPSDATAQSAAKTNAPKGRDAWPEAIEDNSFFIEEAYNQGPGVVQWIFGGLYTFPNKLAALSFTNEWPVPRETHQLSYTIPWTGGGGGQPKDIGDVMLNYRYQLLREKKDGVAMAPRLSVILPTGDWRKGLGYGTTGWQLSLPASKRISRDFAMHFNAGATAHPSAKWLDAGGTTARQNLWGTNEGASLIWLASPRINLMLEAVASQQDEFSASGTKVRTHHALVSPGFRYAFNFPKGQLVVGAAAPIGLTEDTPRNGLFLYLSWEAPVWKVK
jgi:hypothetical protein